MKTIDRFAKWMEENLEKPLYEAEMVRVDLLKADHADAKHGAHHRLKKIISLRSAK